MIIDENLKREYESLIKRMENEFTENLINLNPQKDEYKKEFVERFIIDNKDNLMNIAKYNPKMFLKTISDLRHPQLQYEILNIDSESIDNVTNYIYNLNNEEFIKILQKFFSYPLDVSVEEYYRKWVGKNKIHVKFAKKILSNRYSESKETLKKVDSGKEINDNSHLNGINFDYYKTSLEELKKPKEEKKTSIKTKKESKFKSFFKKKK